MSSSDSAREPSMEDILASIRKIIAEDPAPAAAADASDPDITQDSGLAAAAATPAPTIKADPAAGVATSSSIPMSGRLADALGGLRSAASGKDAAHPTDTPKPRASSFGALDDDLADLLDDAPATPAAPIPAAKTPAAQSAPNAPASDARASSPFGSSFNPPAGLRTGRSAESVAAPRQEKPPVASSSAHRDDEKPLPFGMKSEREPIFSSDNLLKASSSLLGKTPDASARGENAAANASKSQAERPGNQASHAETSRGDVNEPGQAGIDHTKAASTTTGPVVIAAMPPAAKSVAQAASKVSDPVKPDAPAESSLSQGTIQRAASPRPFGFALGAGAASSGQSARDETLGISQDTPADAGRNTGGRGFMPSSADGGSVPAIIEANADSEITEPILIPATRDAAAGTQALASTSALDELAAGLAASVGTVAGGPIGNSAMPSGTPAETPPAAEAGQPPSALASATTTASASSPAVSTSGRTLEETVGELLRPMLREWLDANMPRIVESALRAEMSESVSKSLSSGPGVTPAPNVSSGYATKKPN